MSATALPACHQDSPQHAAYVARVEELEAEGCDTSDAQGIADMEFDALTKPKKPTKPSQKMKKYTTAGCRAVTAENMSEAAGIFADRMARKKYGKTGYARTCNLESWSQDQTLGEYSAFIGHAPAGKHNRGTTVGGNIRFSVYAEEDAK